MSTSLIIPKDPVYPPSMDWQLLRREGIGHIENLASDIWTDYNLHDPGITILEILCYAITDLGYRSNMAPADLFAEPNGGSFYTAAQILPCGPVTALDLRKVLIDMPGVQNAWVEQLEDAEVYFHFPASLTNALAMEKLQPYMARGNEGEVAFPPVPEIDADKLKKMYACLSDKDKEAARQDFRTDMLNKMTDISDPLKQALLLYVTDHYYDEAVFFLESQLPLPLENRNQLLEENIHDLINELAVIRKTLQEGQAYNFSGILPVIATYPALTSFFFQETLLCLYFAGSLKVGEAPEAPAAGDYNLFVPQGIYSVTIRLDEDCEGEEADYIAEAKRRLHRLRNLGEDIAPAIRIAETIGLGIDLAVQVDPVTDKWEVLSNVYRAIEEYLSPTIRFYSLEEMMNRYAQFEIDAAVLEALQTSQVPQELTAALKSMTGKRITGDAAFMAAVAAVWDETAMEDFYKDVFIQSKKYYDADPVYKGPLLQHGFIDEEELVLAQPRQTVYRSDLYQVIAGVAGVLQIERLDMYVCKEEGVTEEAGKWCIAFACKCLPELSIDCSRFSVVTNHTEVPVSMLKLKEYLEVHPQSTTKLNREDMQDLPVPQGRIITDLTAFTSLQMDFPRAYKIGNTGISQKQTAQRQAQAKQLKGYLFFYDQLLSNYLTHLSSVKTFFSVKGEEAAFYQPLYSIPGVKELLLDYKAQTDPGETGPDHSWEDFIADADNDYIKILKELAEGNDTDKKIYRDRLLDHMLARFGEEFTDYALQLYRIEKPLSDGNVWETDEGLDENIADKQRFLQQVPALGAKRGSGFVYFFEKDEYRYWKTDNVEGVRKRVCAILGMQDATRHTITCEPAFEVGVSEMDNPGPNNTETRYEFYIKAKEAGQPRLLVSTEKFKSFEVAKKARLDFLNRAGDSNAYGIVEENLVGFWLNVPAATRSVDNALLLEPHEGREGAEKRLQKIRDLATGNCNDDSFHLLEHILLRPRNSTYTQTLLPMICCTENIEMLDPYSFWITVALPGWAGRFSDEERRNAFMQTLRREMPAHLAVRYALLSREDMLVFEAAYNEWIKRLCTKNQPELAEANDALVTVMNNWNENQIHYF